MYKRRKKKFLPFIAKNECVKPTIDNKWVAVIVYDIVHIDLPSLGYGAAIDKFPFALLNNNQLIIKQYNVYFI